jgi:hypothetical protein
LPAAVVAMVSKDDCAPTFAEATVGERSGIPTMGIPASIIRKTARRCILVCAF